MILPKPLPKIISAKQPSRNPKRMTIAIGMLCEEGLIIAADTQIAMTDGTTREGIKVHQAVADTGVYVMANATDDGNAANTLIPDILTDLQNEDPKDFANVERVVRNSMSEWAERYRQGNPYIQIILGVSLNRPRQQNIRDGGGIRLYNCEPPNTMVPIGRDASEGYIGIGAGASVTDPIFRTLFNTSCSANTALHQVAYLMHRAKKDAATVCGGQTNAVLLKSEFGFPLWVEPRYMRIAEEESGSTFGFCLHMTVCSLLAQTDEAAETIWESIKGYLTNQGKFFRSHRFLTQSGEDVGLPPDSQSQE